MCEHRHHITAYNVEMPTRFDRKTGKEYCDSREGMTTAYRFYASITFCSWPTCEEVFRKEIG